MAQVAGPPRDPFGPAHARRGRAVRVALHRFVASLRDQHCELALREQLLARMRAACARRRERGQVVVVMVVVVVVVVAVVAAVR